MTLKELTTRLFTNTDTQAAFLQMCTGFGMPETMTLTFTQFFCLSMLFTGNNAPAMTRQLIDEKLMDTFGNNGEDANTQATRASVTMQLQSAWKEYTPLHSQYKAAMMVWEDDSRREWKETELNGPEHSAWYTNNFTQGKRLEEAKADLDKRKEIIDRMQAGLDEMGEAPTAEATFIKNWLRGPFDMEFNLPEPEPAVQPEPKTGKKPGGHVKKT